MVTKTYHAPEDTEVAGSAAKSIVDNLQSPEIEDMILQHGLADIKIGDWISVSQLCALFNDVTAHYKGGVFQIFVAMGMKIAEQSEFPPEMLKNLTMPIMIMGWNEHYKANHRGTPLPDITSEEVSDTAFKLHIPGEHPYPYDLVYGMLHGFCRQLLPSKTRFIVAYEDIKVARESWENGVVINISW